MSIKLDSMNMIRSSAIVIVDGELYLDDNHQLALKQAMPEIDEQYADTYQMDLDGELYAFDIFDNHKGEPRFLVAHFREDINKCIEKIEDYAKRNKMIVCSYVDNEVSIFEPYSLNNKSTAEAV